LDVYKKGGNSTMILLSLLLLSFSLEHLLGDVYHPWNHLSPLCRREEGALSSKSSILDSMEIDYIYIYIYISPFLAGDVQ
jgi:hypothetical protein